MDFKLNWSGWVLVKLCQILNCIITLIPCLIVDLIWFAIEDPMSKKPKSAGMELLDIAISAIVGILAGFMFTCGL